MSNSPPHLCAPMEFVLGSPSYLLAYDDRMREYKMPELGDGLEVMVFTFCPFCGARLPESLRPTWFDRLRAMGLEPFDDPIPREYQTDEWWREAGL